MTDALVGARVLVVGVNYAPETTGIAPYTTAVAEHLAASGAQVTAVTGMPHYPQWRVAEEYRGEVLHEERLHGVRVRRAGHYVPADQDALKRGAFEVSWLPLGALQALRTPADAVVAVSPSLGALPLARLASACRGVPWAAVVQDLMGNAAANGGLRGGGRVAGLVSGVEGRALRSADLVGVISEGFADAVQRMGVAPDRTRLLPNWSHVTPATATREQARAALGWDAEVFSVVHTGNMGAKQGLDNVVRAAAEAGRRGLPVEFVLVGDGNQRAALQAAGAGVRSLRFVDPVDSDSYPLVLAAADVLLVNERADMLEMSLPSKLTSYFAAGRPVLGAVPQAGWTAAVLDASAAAVRVAPEEPGQLLAAVLELAADHERRTLLGKAATEFCHARYGSVAALGRYADLVRELLDAGPRAGRQRGWAPRR
jgi:colanic acid biosynthesis glycosyl transferase WcaI